MKKLQKFSKIIFYSLTQKQTSIILSLKEFLDEKNDFAFELIPEYPILSERISNDCLVVTSCGMAGQNHDSRVYDLLFRRGIPLSISCDHFLMHSFSILKNQNILCLGEIALLFLPEHLKNLLERIFILYGFRVKSIDSFSQLEQLEKQNFIHIVFDQDLSGTSQNNPKRGGFREESIRKIKKISLSNNNMSVFVVKDFQQGSLFDDITSSVRDICNLLLSYEEYLIFIKSFLHYSSISRLMQGQKKVFENSVQSKCFHWSKLHNPKKIYSELLESVQSPGNGSTNKEILWLNTSMNDLVQLELNLLFISWLDDYLTHSEESKNRASFRFVESVTLKEPPSIGSSKDSSKPSSVPFHNNRVDPHVKLIASNELNSMEGGPI